MQGNTPPPRWIVPWINVHVGHWLYNGAISTAVIAVFTLLAAGELNSFARSSGRETFTMLSRLGAAGLAIGPYFVFNSVAAAGHTGEAWGVFLLAIVLALAFLRQAKRSGTADVMTNMSTTVFIIIYIRKVTSGSKGTKLSQPFNNRNKSFNEVVNLFYSVKSRE